MTRAIAKLIFEWLAEKQEVQLSTLDEHSCSREHNHRIGACLFSLISIMSCQGCGISHSLHKFLPLKQKCMQILSEKGKMASLG